MVTTLNLTQGIQISQTTAGTAGACTITGLVSWANNQYGIYLQSPSKVKIRNSVSADNTQYGIVLQNNGNAANGTSITGFDFGTSASDPGGNWFQMTKSTGLNSSGGMCITWGSNAVTGTLYAAGNEWNTGPVGNPNLQTQVNCATTTATITKQASGACGGTASYGANAVLGTVTTVFDMCD